MIAFASDPEPTRKKRALEPTPQPPQQLASRVLNNYRAYLDNMLGYATNSHSAAVYEHEALGENDQESAEEAARYVKEGETLDKMIRALEHIANPALDVDKPADVQETFQEGIKLLNKYKPMATQFGCSEDEMSSLIADISQIAGFDKAARAGESKPNKGSQRG